MSMLVLDNHDNGDGGDDYKQHCQCFRVPNFSDNERSIMSNRNVFLWCFSVLLLMGHV